MPAARPAPLRNLEILSLKFEIRVKKKGDLLSLNFIPILQVPFFFFSEFEMGIAQTLDSLRTIAHVVCFPRDFLLPSSMDRSILHHPDG